METAAETPLAARLAGHGAQGHGALHPDLAPGALHDITADREAEARAEVRALRGEEGFPYLIEDRSRDAGARVAHLDLHHAAVASRGHRDRVFTRVRLWDRLRRVYE